VRELEERAEALVVRLREEGANLAVENGRQAVAEGVAALERRGAVACDSDRVRVRNRALVRYYARTIEHLVSPRRGALQP
jgi:hypothetical protein